MVQRIEEADVPVQAACFCIEVSLDCWYHTPFAWHYPTPSHLSASIVVVPYFICLIISDQFNQFLFLSRQSNHLYLKDNFSISRNTWLSGRGRASLWTEGKISLYFTEFKREEQMSKFHFNVDKTRIDVKYTTCAH